MAMKSLLTGLLAGAAILPALAQTADDIETKYPGYKLAFNQEFSEGVGENKDEVDHEVWNLEYGFKRNNEDQCYMDRKENAFIRDGKLVIRALDKSETVNPFYDRHSSDKHLKDKHCYTSASLQSKARFHFGIWETCAKLTPHDGLWPAIWGTGNTRGWPSAGELDIMEYYGDAIHANLAWGDDWQHVKWNSRAPKMAEFDKDFGDKYHIWRTEWDHNSLRIYLDDRLLNETNLDMTVNSDGYNPYRDPNNGFQVWLNLALGGNNGGNPAAPTYPAEYLVDYTRVYIPESADAALIYRISKARKLLDESEEGYGPMQYPAEARLALEKAIDEAKTVLGATDDATIDAALDTLQSAMDTYTRSMSTGVKVGETFSLLHTASQGVLASGWFEEKECVIIVPKDDSDYNRKFTLVDSPKKSNKGYNLLTGDGKYVYRNSWNLFVSDDKSKLDSDNYLFNLEVADGKIIVKNVGSGKYFGTDDSFPWIHVYSDKAGAGNPKGYFELAEAAGVETLAGDGNLYGASGVYNLQGIRVADTPEVISAGGIYIVINGGHAKKIIKR